MLIFILQTASSIVTTMGVVAPEFFTDIRDRGLDALEVPPPADLLGIAMSPGAQTHEFWHAGGAMEPHYWSILLRRMLDPDAAVKEDRKHGAHIVALALRFYTVARVLRCLLVTLRDVRTRCKAVASNAAVGTLVLNLHAFLRLSLDREPTEDPDPYRLIARNVHAHVFSGRVETLRSRSRAALSRVLQDIETKHGHFVHSAIAHAVHAAGAAMDTMLQGDTAPLEDGDDEKKAATSSAATTAGGAPTVACENSGPLLLTQLPLIRLLNGLLLVLGKQVQEEDVLTAVYQKRESLLKLATHAV